MTVDETQQRVDAGVAKITADLRSNWQGRCVLWIMRRLGWPR